MGVTFLFVTIAWVFFRSETIVDALNYIEIMFFSFEIPKSYRYVIFSVLTILTLDWINRKDERDLTIFKTKYRGLVYFIMLWLILSKFNNHQQFIYFNF